jgi:hypothetical protein
MRKVIVVILVVAAGCSSSTEAPRLGAGVGIQVDDGNNSVSIDSSKVPVLPSCGLGQLVQQDSTAGSWICVAAAPDAARLGGLAPSSYAAATQGVANDAAKLAGRPASSYALATDGVADDASRLAGHLAGSYLSQDPSGTDYNLKGDIRLGDFRELVSHTQCFRRNVSGDCEVSAGTSVSVGATFCGTAPSSAGSFPAQPEPNSGNPVVKASGYRAGKLLCQKTYGPAAHVCSGEEMVRSAQLGIAINAPLSGFWYSSGSMSSDERITDCMGWTSHDAGLEGPVWSDTFPNFGHCDVLRPVACCR